MLILLAVNLLWYINIKLDEKYLSQREGIDKVISSAEVLRIEESFEFQKYVIVITSGIYFLLLYYSGLRKNTKYNTDKTM